MSTPRLPLVVPLEELVTSSGDAIPRLVLTSATRGYLSLDRDGKAVRASCHIEVLHPERLARLGARGSLVDKFGDLLFYAAYERATLEARRRGLPLHAQWRVGGGAGKSAARRAAARQRARRLADAERRAEAILAADRAEKAAARRTPPPPPPTAAERDAALAASIVELHRRHSGGASGAPTFP